MMQLFTLYPLVALPAPSEGEGGMQRWMENLRPGAARPGPGDERLGALKQISPSGLPVSPSPGPL
jgi:hypothetical protein